MFSENLRFVKVTSVLEGMINFYICMDTSTNYLVWSFWYKKTLLLIIFFILRASLSYKPSYF